MIDAAIHRIRAYAISQGWSVSKLAKESGCNWGAVSGVFDDPDWSPTVRTLRRMESVVPADFVPPSTSPESSHPGVSA